MGPGRSLSGVLCRGFQTCSGRNRDPAGAASPKQNDAVPPGAGLARSVTPGRGREIERKRLPATWLLQYDALTEGPFVEFLKAEMPASHEVGIWFEMNRRLCDDARIPWRGRPDWEWDYHVPIAYSIGYPPEERRRLIDTAMATFERIFERKVKTVASWNLDAVTASHLADRYHIDALGNCRDQLATDGFTIWGAPIAAYYPSRKNAWSPAVETKNQIGTPMFRLLGQDPVYYYDKSLPYPDTMEPVWPSGRSRVFIDRFLQMIAESPTQSVAYAQLGQENSFGWPEMQQAYLEQMEALARLRRQGKVQVETMGTTGRRFKVAFTATPTQAQIMLEDPFGKNDPAERTIWYQSRFYRANLHVRGAAFYLRDLHVYSDDFEQPYLTETVQQHGIEQRLLAVMDGYHWSETGPSAGRDAVRAMGEFAVIDGRGERRILTTEGLLQVQEEGHTLQARVGLQGGGTLLVTFKEDTILMKVEGRSAGSRLVLSLEWAPGKSSFVGLRERRLLYRFRDFNYGVTVLSGKASSTERGVQIAASAARPLRLYMAQGRRSGDS